MNMLVTINRFSSQAIFLNTISMITNAPGDIIGIQLRLRPFYTAPGVPAAQPTPK
jgi:hypothetical protein